MNQQQVVNYYYNTGSGSTGTPDTTVDGRQVFLVIGDGVNAGLNSHTSSTLPSSGTAFEYDRNTNTIINFGVGAGITGFSFNAKSPWANFCIQYNTTFSFKPVIINRASDQSTISTASNNNDWQTTGTNYNAAITAANNCLSALGLTKLKGIFICAGIEDVKTTNGTGSFTVAQVGTFFNTLISNLITQFGSDVPILITQIGQTTSIQVTARLTGVRNAIKAACVANTNVNFSSSLSSFLVGSLYEDGQNPNRTGNDYLGAMHCRWFSNSSSSKWARSIIACHFDEPTVTFKTAINTWIASWTNEYLSMDWFYSTKSTLRLNTAFDWAFLCAPETDGGYSFTASDSIRTDSNTLFYIGYNQLLSIINMSQNDYAIELKIKQTNTPAGTDCIAFGVSNAGTTSNTYFRQTTANVAWGNNLQNVIMYLAQASMTPGSWIFSRSASNAVALFLNGLSVSTGTNASLALLSLRFYIGARNVNGSPLSQADVSIERCIGVKRSAISNMANFVTGLNTLQTAA